MVLPVFLLLVGHILLARPIFVVLRAIKTPPFSLVDIQFLLQQILYKLFPKKFWIKKPLDLKD